MGDGNPTWGGEFEFDEDDESDLETYTNSSIGDLSEFEEFERILSNIQKISRVSEDFQRKPWILEAFRWREVLNTCE